MTRTSLAAKKSIGKMSSGGTEEFMKNSQVLPRKKRKKGTTY
jgi:hypothetical protein